MNKLYYGDCLQVMNEWPKWCVDLIYLDPPFNSNRQYNAIYSDATGRPLPTQIEAFCDTWTLDAEQERQIRTIPVLMREAGIDDEVAEFWRLWMNAMRHTQPSTLAYLAYMVPRLLHMKVILKPAGSIYLHCDPTMSHYIKIMMDGIFGHRNFQNEFIWHYGGGGASRKRWARKHDVILFYTNGAKSWTFNADDVRTAHKWTSGQKRADGSERDERGKLAEDVWSHHGLMPWASERLGYPTQKPLALLERIIKASSNPGDMILDPFCGCATTLEAAHELGREWIGIDIAIHAIKRVAKARLEDRLGLVEDEDFTISGVPNSFDSALDLWTRDKYHFQKWAVEQVDGFVTTKRSADGGIDGRIYFPLTTEAPDLESMVVEVKGGRNVGIGVLRELRGVLERDEAAMAGLIVMHPPAERQARSFGSFMAQAGTVTAYGRDYERMQMLTVAEILDGNRFDTPAAAARGLAKPVIPGLKLPPKTR